MNKKGIMICSLIGLICVLLLTMGFYDNDSYDTPTSIYQVYLDGNKIGLINSKDELYNLINEEQVEIKEEYKVDQVYPPKGFKLVKKTTYDEELSTVEDIYNIIKDNKEFTIKGYTIIIKSNQEGVEPQYLYVLDDKIFEEAITNVVETFIGKERYNQFKTDTQSPIVDVGYIIEEMKFNEEIKIKESYISAEEKIYTDVTDLTRHLLFDENQPTKEYTVVQGDTLEKIAENNELNVTELLIANDNIQNEDTLLAIGQKINVALINPMLSLVYQELVVSDTKIYYETEYIDDNTQYIGYKKVQTAGEDGIVRVPMRVQFVNGVESQNTEEAGERKIIKPAVNEVIVRGTKKYPTSSGNTPIPINPNSNWTWPTNSTYYTSSSYGWRTLNGYREFHDGLDIPNSAGAPIYAALDGTVINASWGGAAGSAAGLNVVILHENGYSTVYAHCSKVYVKNGQQVTRGQTIAAVGQTGRAFGNHLHFGLFWGVPYSNGKGLNPLQLWR